MQNCVFDWWQVSEIPQWKYGEGYILLAAIFGFVFPLAFAAARQLRTERENVSRIAETVSSLRLFRTGPEVESLLEKDERDLSDLMLLLVSSVRTVRRYTGFLPGRLIRQLVSTNSTESSSGSPIAEYPSDSDSEQVGDSESDDQLGDSEVAMLYGESCFVGIDLGLCLGEIPEVSSLLSYFEVLFSEIMKISREFDCSLATLHESLIVISWENSSIVQCQPIEFCMELIRHLGTFSKMFSTSSIVFVVYTTPTFYGHACSLPYQRRFLLAEEDRPLTWLLQVVREARLHQNATVMTKEIVDALEGRIGKNFAFKMNDEQFYSFS